MLVKSIGAVFFAKAPVCCHTHKANSVSYTLFLFLKLVNAPGIVSGSLIPR